MNQKGKSFQFKEEFGKTILSHEKLFTATLEEVFKKCVFNEASGLNIDGERLTDLRFADDIVWIDETSDKIQRTLNELSEQGKTMD